MNLNQTNATISYSHQLTKKLDYYVILLTLPLGLVGNLISFLIFIRPCLNKRTNTGFLYSILCVLNILTIIEYNLIAYSNLSLKFTFDLPCRLEYFSRELLADSLTWMQAMISLDRFVLIFFPGRANFMTKKVLNILNFNLIILKTKAINFSKNDFEVGFVLNYAWNSRPNCDHQLANIHHILDNYM